MFFKNNKTNNSMEIYEDIIESYKLTENLIYVTDTYLLNENTDNRSFWKRVKDFFVNMWNIIKNFFINICKKIKNIFSRSTEETTKIKETVRMITHNKNNNFSEEDIKKIEEVSENMHNLRDRFKSRGDEVKEVMDKCKENIDFAEKKLKSDDDVTSEDQVNIKKNQKDISDSFNKFKEDTKRIVDDANAKRQILRNVIKKTLHDRSTGDKEMDEKDKKIDELLKKLEEK